MAFSKPRNDDPTRHLFVGNAGPAVGDTGESLHELFAPFGEVVDIQMPKGRSHVFVSFYSAEQATIAMEALRGAPSAASKRSLIIKFSDRREEQVSETPVVCMSSEQIAIPGLLMIPSFVTEEEEQDLLAAVDRVPKWEDLARRRVLHYGYKFDYITRNIDSQEFLGPIPDFLQDVKIRIEAVPLVDVTVDQVTVNEYPSGVGLSAHIDTHSAFSGAIMSLSLAGDTVMEFRRADNDRRRIFLPRRSLLVMSGEARYAWAHYIPHRKSDNINGQEILRAKRRVSFTFRKARGFACECGYPEHCDSQGSTMPPTRMAQKLQIGNPYPSLAEHMADGVAVPPNQNMSLELASGAIDPDFIKDWQSPEEKLKALEAKHVHEVYNAIAPHFSSTRVAIWPKVREFIESLESGSVLVDAGCGNGKYFGVRQDIAVLASDRSQGLVSQARRRIVALEEKHAADASAPSVQSVRAASLSEAECSPAADVCIADAMQLPLRSGSCDALVCIAVLHHMSSPGRRIETLEELARVLKPGGRLLVTVWAQEQENQKKLAKWHPIAKLTDTCNPFKGQPNEDTGKQNADGENAPMQESVDHTQGIKDAVDGGDYFVPWHLPFHRAEAVTVLHSMAKAQETSASQPGQNPAAAALCSENSSGGGQVNHQKGSVMFQRYYHLFRQGELSRLGAEVKSCEVEREFFDASNWCMIMRKISDKL